MGWMAEYIALDGQEWLGTGIVALFAAQKWRRKLYFAAILESETPIFMLFWSFMVL